MSTLQTTEHLARQLDRLGRADLIRLAPALCDLIRREGSVYWWIDPELYRAFERCGIHLSQVSFYSPLPDIGALSNSPVFQRPIGAAVPLFQTADHVKSWLGAARYLPEFADGPWVRGGSGYQWDNPFFPNVDAVLYYGLIRQLGPQRIVEIGGGFSSQIAARALRENRRGTLTVIEPYPSPALRRLGGEVALVEEAIQTVSPELTGALGPGDILFVDSSHVTRTGSDLNHIFFEILPRLPRGVYLHFHDIFLPLEYPREWAVERGWAWNEQYLLLAWLMGGPPLRPLCSSTELLRHHPALLRDAFAKRPGAGTPSGSSLWLAPT